MSCDNPKLQGLSNQSINFIRHTTLPSQPKKSKYKRIILLTCKKQSVHFTHLIILFLQLASNDPQQRRTNIVPKQKLAILVIIQDNNDHSIFNYSVSPLFVAYLTVHLIHIVLKFLPTALNFTCDEVPIAFNVYNFSNNPKFSCL